MVKKTEETDDFPVVPPKKTFTGTLKINDPEKSKPVFTDLCLGFAKNKETGAWHLTSIPFNMETKEVGELEVYKEGDIKAIIWERFQVEVINKLYGEI